MGVGRDDKLCLLAILVLASPFALGLPSTSRGAAARTLAFGLVGRKYYLGSALILTPFFIPFFVIDLLFTEIQDARVATTIAICEVVLMVCLMIVAMTYVTRVYVRGAIATK